MSDQVIDLFATIWLLSIIVLPVLIFTGLLEWWLDRNDPFK